MDTNELTNAIVQIPDVADAAPETRIVTLLDVGERIAALGEILKDARQMWERKMVQQIQAHGPVKCGDTLYTVKTPPTTKCVDVPGAVQAIFVATGGDFDRFCEHLSSGAIKHGASKQTLSPEEFDRLFVVTREPELSADEATPARLKKINLAFIR